MFCFVGGVLLLLFIANIHLMKGKWFGDNLNYAKRAFDEFNWDWIDYVECWAVLLGRYNVIANTMYIMERRVFIVCCECFRQNFSQIHNCTYFLMIISGKECLRLNNPVCGFRDLVCGMVPIPSGCLSKWRMLCVIIISFAANSGESIKCVGSSCSFQFCTKSKFCSFRCFCLQEIDCKSRIIGVDFVCFAQA